jgi:hypothetical protein
MSTLSLYSLTISLCNIITRYLPGGKRIRIINMRARHITFNKAIKQLSL